MILLLTCPESPRFYVKNGQVDRAHAMLAKYHANGDMNDPLVKFELAEIVQVIGEENSKPRSSYLDFARTPGNRRRIRVVMLLGIGSNIVGNGIVSYYLSPVLKSVGVTDPLKITCINGGLAVWNLIFAWGAAIYADRIGRRTLFLISMSGMFLSYVFVMGFSAGFAQTKKDSLGLVVIPASLLLQL